MKKIAWIIRKITVFVFMVVMTMQMGIAVAGCNREKGSLRLHTPKSPIALVGEIPKTYLLAKAGDKESNIIRMQNDVEATYFVELAWECTLPNVESYLFEYSQDKDFSNAVKVEKSGEVFSLKLYNLYKEEVYYYRVTAKDATGAMLAEKSASFKTWSVGPRVISVDGIYNARDLGGYKTQYGKTTRQGLLYRGSEMNGTHGIQITEQGRKTMLEDLGIVSDIDLRGRAEADNITQSPLGTSVGFYYHPIGAYATAFSQQEQYRALFSRLAQKDNYPVYFHCWGGADRTGTVAFILNALCGVSLEDLIHDFEFTGFSNFGARTFYKQGSVLSIHEFYDRLNADFEGESLAEKTENFLLSTGVTKEEMENIRAIMFGEREEFVKKG